MKKAIGIIFALVILSQLSYAAGNYASLEVNIDKLDVVKISGDTNFKSLLTEGTEQYITKDKGVRTLTIETKETFSEYIAKLNFPKGTSINYVKTSGGFRLETSNGKLAIITTGENKPFSITVQYQIGNQGTSPLYYALLLIPIAIAIVLLIKKKKPIKEKKPEPSLKGLTHRQKMIVQLLIDENKPLTQKDLEESLKLPKASISRNIKTLELKGVIEKERTGMSNKITLKKRD